MGIPSEFHTTKFVRKNRWVLEASETDKHQPALVSVWVKSVTIDFYNQLLNIQIHDTDAFDVLAWVDSMESIMNRELVFSKLTGNGDEIEKFTFTGLSIVGFNTCKFNYDQDGIAFYEVTIKYLQCDKPEKKPEPVKLPDVSVVFGTLEDDTTKIYTPIREIIKLDRLPGLSMRDSQVFDDLVFYVDINTPLYKKFCDATLGERLGRFVVTKGLQKWTFKNVVLKSLFTRPNESKSQISLKFNELIINS